MIKMMLLKPKINLLNEFFTRLFDTLQLFSLVRPRSIPLIKDRLLKTS